MIKLFSNKLLILNLKNMKKYILIITTIIPLHLLSQVINYNDVAVIVNDNSQTSIDIGNYFQSARNIPSQNIIHILAPITEQINNSQFQQIRSQIENQLTDLTSNYNINYLVTTKGIPLTIDADCFFDSIPGETCASVDSELALILGPHSNFIGQSGMFPNPYYMDTVNFTRDSVGIFLVTRLDGYTKNDVFNLIDRSGPFVGINKSSANGIVEINNPIEDSVYFASLVLPSYDYLTNNSWNSILDLYSSPLTNQSNVFGYFSTGHGPLHNTPFNYTWTNGSFGTLSMCRSAFTFDIATNVNQNYLAANLIADGCTGSFGYVNLTFFSLGVKNEIFLNRYLDTASTFNLAESYYMADKTLSWQTVIIGDPKSNIYVDNLANNTGLFTDKPGIFPNPSEGNLNIHSENAIISITVYDLNGAIVFQMQSLNCKSVEFNLYEEINNGLYVINVETENNTYKERIIINK